MSPTPLSLYQSRGAIWPSLSPCTVINPILLTYLLISIQESPTPPQERPSLSKYYPYQVLRRLEQSFSNYSVDRPRASENRAPRPEAKYIPSTLFLKKTTMSLALCTEAKKKVSTTVTLNTKITCEYPHPQVPPSLNNA